MPPRKSKVAVVELANHPSDADSEVSSEYESAVVVKPKRIRKIRAKKLVDEPMEANVVAHVEGGAVDEAEPKPKRKSKKEPKEPKEPRAKRPANIWVRAVKRYNEENPSKSYFIPERGTVEHSEVQKIMDELRALEV